MPTAGTICVGTACCTRIRSVSAVLISLQHVKTLALDLRCYWVHQSRRRHTGSKMLLGSYKSRRRNAGSKWRYLSRGHLLPTQGDCINILKSVKSIYGFRCFLSFPALVLFIFVLSSFLYTCPGKTDVNELLWCNYFPGKNKQ